MPSPSRRCFWRTADEVVPYASMDEAAEHLSAAGFETYTFTMQGTGHGIAPDGLGQAVGFLRMKFGLEG
jgi:phospholipase/carboxylesterase